MAIYLSISLSLSLSIYVSIYLGSIYLPWRCWWLVCKKEDCGGRSRQADKARGERGVLKTKDALTKLKYGHSGPGVEWQCWWWQNNGYPNQVQGTRTFPLAVSPILPARTVWKAWSRSRGVNKKKPTRKLASKSGVLPCSVPPTVCNPSLKCGRPAPSQRQHLLAPPLALGTRLASRVRLVLLLARSPPSHVDESMYVACTRVRRSARAVG